MRGRTSDPGADDASPGDGGDVPATPGVVAPPPLIFAAAIVVGLLLHHLVWPATLPDTGWAGKAVLGAGFGLVLLTMATFLRHRTSPDPHRPDRALIRAGVFRFSRNPIYVGMILMTIGVSLDRANGWILAGLVPAIAMIRNGVVLREERHLARVFGDAYLEYQREVRRWL